QPINLEGRVCNGPALGLLAKKCRRISSSGTGTRARTGTGTSTRTHTGTSTRASTCARTGTRTSRCLESRPVTHALCRWTVRARPEQHASIGRCAGGYLLGLQHWSEVAYRCIAFHHWLAFSEYRIERHLGEWSRVLVFLAVTCGADYPNRTD